MELGAQIAQRNAMRITIYHNPNCSNSRRCLEILREAGYEPAIVEYLQHPPNAAELGKLAARMGVSARDIVRTKEKTYAELELSDADDATLLKAMAANPILLNRPIVVTGKGVKLCRPPESVRELL